MKLFPYLAPAMAAGLALAACGRTGGQPEAIWAAYQQTPLAASLSIRYPLAGAVFPPEIAPPRFEWTEASSGADEWLISLDYGGAGRQFFHPSSAAWTPTAAAWEDIKRQSAQKLATATILGVRRSNPSKVLIAGKVTFSTSRDPVGAPLFYREVNLPFIEAVKDPSRIRWRFGPISSPGPAPVVLENLPVCGNCHSFPRDGQVLAMDVDYANNKGSYITTPVAEEMRLSTSDIITWDDFRRDDGEQTFGLLSQISPDGRYVISTVKDQSVFVDRPGLEFSQLFFPVKGILAVYDRQAKTFQALPGADDPRYVQSNPAWSPDGKTIVFARARAYDLKQPRALRKVLLSAEECREFLVDGKAFQFDLCQIPFNGGQGGRAELLAGAATNGASNFFPKYSPDGQWIVFCRANSYMLLQPDSELWLVPAAGGAARRLAGNTARMNSWHSWSPNSRWLVFSSKQNGPYTQLWLTHVDAQGQSAPPVVLAQMSAPDRAANIPEFVNLPPAAIRTIHEQFLDDFSFARAGHEFFKRGDAPGAIRQYERALALNPKNAAAHQRLGYLLYHQAGRPAEGLAHTRAALQLEPGNGSAHFDLAMALMQEYRLGPASPKAQLQEVTRHLSDALKAGPELIPPYLPADMLFHYGRALVWSRMYPQAIPIFKASLRLEPGNAEAHYWLAIAQAHTGLIEEPLRELAAVRQAHPELDRSAALHDRLGMNYSQQDRYAEAITQATQALNLAEAAQQRELAAQIRQRIAQYQKRQPWADEEPKR